MSQEGRAALKAFFETGDKPTQAQFADLIDSFFNFIDDNTLSVLQTLYSSATQTRIILDSDSGASIVFSTATGGTVHIAPDSGAESFLESFINADKIALDIGFNLTAATYNQFSHTLRVTNVPDTSFQVMIVLVNNAGSFEIGFFGHIPASQQVITGSRGGNAALASLLTGLDNSGLIIDSTTP